MFYSSKGIGNLGCRKSQRRISKTNNQNAGEFKLFRPLQGQNYLPMPLKKQLDRIQFLSQKTLNEVVCDPLNDNYYDSPDNLFQMKLAAEKQQQKMRQMNRPILCVVPNYCESVFESLVNSQHSIQLGQRPSFECQDMNDTDGMDLQANFQLFNDNYEHHGSIIPEDNLGQDKQENYFF